MTLEGSQSRAAGPWRGLRRFSDRTPLRTKLITALLALVIVALAAISVSSSWLLRSYLTSQDDTQLQAAFNGITNGQTISIDPGRIYSTHGFLLGVELPGTPLTPPQPVPNPVCPRGSVLLKYRLSRLCRRA